MKWIVGVSVIAIAMGWAATMTIPAATVTLDEAALKYFPPETRSIAYIDVAGLKTAPLVQEALGKITELPPPIADFANQTGFDVKQDLDRVTIGNLGPRETLAVVEARFDKFKVEQFIKDKGGESETYLGRSIYRDHDGAITVLDGVILAGQIDAVKKALDQATLPGSLPLKAELLDAVRTIEAGNQIWAVGDFSINDLPPVGIRGPAPAVEMLKSLRGGTYQMRIDQDVHVRAMGNFADADNARNLSETARGLIAIAKLQVAKQPELLHALDGVQVSNSGLSITVRVDESGDLLKKLQHFKPALERFQ